MMLSYTWHLGLDVHLGSPLNLRGRKQRVHLIKNCTVGMDRAVLYRVASCDVTGDRKLAQLDIDKVKYTQ